MFFLNLGRFSADGKTLRFLFSDGVIDKSLALGGGSGRLRLHPA